MIFSENDHIWQILKGSKTQTRRKSDRHQVGRTYCIQHNRTAPGLKDGRILILEKWREHRGEWVDEDEWISEENAKAEGGYSAKRYEELYEQLHPGWRVRWAYKFRFVSQKEQDLVMQANNCLGFGTRYGGYNCCIACDRADRCNELTGDTGV